MFWNCIAPGFPHLTQRWKTLFQARLDILLYDLTSAYFESDPPGDGDSRDKHSDGMQIIPALIVTPEGFLLTYEVLAGSTGDKTTLTDFLVSIEDQCGRANRIRVMDRGIPANSGFGRYP
jgi:hypothetical protein